MKNRFCSSTLHDGFIHGFEETLFACKDITMGELKWKGGRYGHGKLLLASGRLVITSQTGNVVLAKVTPEGHREIALSHAVDGKTWNVPAMRRND